MTQLKLNPVALDLRTSKTRLIGRYRLAGDHQLGAHTPRPQAPGDSLLSVQIHESAMNNVVEQLSLDGKESDLRELYREICAKFARPDLEVPDEVPMGVKIRFSDSQAIHVRFEQESPSLAVGGGTSGGTLPSGLTTFPIPHNSMPTSCGKARSNSTDSISPRSIESL